MWWSVAASAVDKIAERSRLDITAATTGSGINYTNQGKESLS